MAFNRSRKRITTLLFVSFAWMACLLAASAQDAPRLSLLELREVVSAKERSILTFRLEGVVCASSAPLGLIALNDGTSAALMELPSLPPDLHPGDRVLISGSNCLVGRGALAIQIGTVPVIEIDGSHPALTKSGTVFLQEGMRAFRLEWYNGYSNSTLDLDYERSDMDRQKVPPGVLWHRESDEGEFKPGLEYLSYVGTKLVSVSDLHNLEPTAKGVVKDFDTSVRARNEMVGLVFSGFLQIPRSGLYTFHLTADDGARLTVTDPSVTCSIVREDRSPVTTNSLAKALYASTVDQWVAFEGLVTYASRANNRLELDVTGNSHGFHVTVADGAGLDPSALLHKNVKITGLKRESGIVTIGASQIEIVPGGHDPKKILTNVYEVRQLQPDDPVKSYRAEIQGVVTMAQVNSFVLQDATGGVFVHYYPSKSENPPRPSELWKIEGNTAPGDFSPVLRVTSATYLGNAALPKPVQPTHQQLASGSLDAELVEIEGVVMTASDSELRLLTRAGNVTVLGDAYYPLLTRLWSEKECASLVGCAVRLRGVCRAVWDLTTGAAQPAQLMLGNVTLSVDEPASEDPFFAPLILPSELSLFTSHPTALKRVRISGQLLLARPPELFLFDGTSGFRATAREAQELVPGDMAEVSGFPQLGGPSPELLEARARKVGHSPLPVPAKVPYWNLPDAKLDSTLVEVEATLLSDTVRLDERALEMRTGTNRFVAFVPSEKSMPPGIERDSIVRLTGVYVSATADRTLSSSDPFEMRLYNTGNIVVLKRGPWWTKRHTIAVIAILSAGLVLAGSWVTLLRRTVAKRSGELALEIEERESVERNRAMERERSRMAKDLHDELGSGLTEAGILSSLMKNPAIPMDEKEGYLDQLSGLCCTLVTGLDEIVWAVNPRYDSVADLAGYFSLYAQRFLKLAGIECRLKIDDAITGDPLDSRMRHEIFLAFKEALNNVVRHAGATEVNLTIEVVTGCLMILIADNGCGFDRLDDLPGSDGLRNMEERIQTLGGTCMVETSPRDGTTIQFKISLKENSL
ncbi:MAG: ATP-binding protein [Verrucomicrobiota bacterium]